MTVSTVKNFLKTNGTKIIHPQEGTVILQGVNLGGWLMMEGYILHSLNFPVQQFKKKFKQRLGQAALEAFESEFRNNFIREDDLCRIAGFGFNCIRLPFHYRLIESRPCRYSNRGTAYLDRLLNWAKRRRLWVILDLHAAPGAQNHDWHSDSQGKAELWTRKDFQKRTYALWEFLADRYKGCEAVAGYDILNEAVTEDVGTLNAFYRNIIQHIRRVDKNHIIFVEGNTWAVDLDCLAKFEDDNLALSIHAYQPLDFTSHFVPHLTYPFRYNGQRWNKNIIRKQLSHYAKIAQRRAVPVFVGEFGVNYRQGLYGENLWVQDMLALFKEFGFSWTYWTYKAIKNNIFPDGLLSYYDNPPWVNRQGPLLGWDTYALHWPKRKNEIIRFWQSGDYKENTSVLDVLKDAAK